MPFWNASSCGMADGLIFCAKWAYVSLVYSKLGFIPTALVACYCTSRWVLIGEKMGRNPQTAKTHYQEMTTVANPNKGEARPFQNDS
jgi:hypothetical protein